MSLPLNQAKIMKEISSEVALKQIGYEHNKIQAKNTFHKQAAHIEK